jgi:hypothetical protein
MLCRPHIDALTESCPEARRLIVDTSIAPLQVIERRAYKKVGPATPIRLDISAVGRRTPVSYL